MNAWEQEMRNYLLENDEDSILQMFQRGFPLNMPIRHPLNPQQRNNLPCILYEFRMFQTLLKILKMNKSPDVPNSQGLTVLMMAMKEGDIDFAKRLVRMGADICRKNYNGDTILHIAAENRQLECVKYLVNTLKVQPRTVNNRNETPYKLALKLSNNSEDDDLAEILDLLRAAERSTGPIRGLMRNSPNVPRMALSKSHGALTSRTQATSPLSFLTERRVDFEQQLLKKQNDIYANVRNRKIVPRYKDLFKSNYI